MQNRKIVTSYLLKSVIFLVTIAGADLVIGTMLKNFYHNQKYGDDYITRFAAENATPQTLIIGSSRAVNIFDPCVFRYELNTKTFNAGRIGQSIFYHYAILKTVLKRYTPEIVVLSLDRRDFAIDKSDYDKLSELLPLYGTHPEIRPILNLKSPFEKVKMMSSIYPYNSFLLPILRGYLSDKSKVTYNGYRPLEKIIGAPVPIINYDLYVKLDSIKINIFRSLITDCKNAGIKLFLTCPPYMVQAAGIDQSIVTAKRIAAEYDIPFFDESESVYYTARREYFADFRHLNESGSLAFSREIALKIKRSLNNQK